MRVIEGVGLCHVQDFLGAYNVGVFDFDREPGSTGNKRVINMCQDCPMIADCYNDGVDFVRKDLEISGVFGGYDAYQILKHVIKDRRDHKTISEVCANLLERQVANTAIWNTFMQTQDREVA